MIRSKTLPIERIGLARDALAGQVAVVTGAGQGIGREVVRALARLGAQVVIAELNEASGQETEAIIRQEGGQALFIRTDVSSEADVVALAERTHAAYGPVDILVNNAAVEPVASVLEMDVALWDRVIGVNLRGTFLTCKAFLPGMVERKCGIVVNMTSADAIPFMSAYIASKSGIAGFSESLAAEVGPQGVRVIAFTPGLVDTPGLRVAADDLTARLGMSRREFLGAVMPARRAALATVYLVAVLADEYHGEQVDGYSVLERAGLANAREADAQAAVASVAPVVVTARAVTVQEAAALCGRVQRVVSDTVAEFERFPVFVRPLVQRGLKVKSGQRAQDWPRTVAELAVQLRGMAAGDATAEAAFRAAYPRLRLLLEGLARYYRESPAEAARFTRDAAFIAEATRIANEREVAVRSLLEALDVL